MLVREFSILVNLHLLYYFFSAKFKNCLKRTLRIDCLKFAIEIFPDAKPSFLKKNKNYIILFS